MQNLGGPRRAVRKLFATCCVALTMSPISVLLATSRASATTTGTSYANVYPGPNWEGPSGLTRFRTIDRVIVPRRLTDYLFFSTVFGFGDSGVGAYEGIQTTNLALFSVWDAIDAVPGPGSYCLHFGGEGEGLSCRAQLAVVAGHKYAIHVAIDHTDGNYQWWHGTVSDLTADTTVDLGLIEAPNTQAATAPADFMEYFGGDRSALSCDQYPYAVGDFQTPLLGPVDGSEPVPAVMHTPPYGGFCGENGTMTTTVDGVRVEFGGPLPTAPRNLTGNLRQRAGTLFWTKPVSDGGSPILSTTIEASIDGGRTFRTIGRVAGSRNSAKLSALDPRTNAIRIAAVNASGVGAYSDTLRLASAPHIVKVVPGSGRATISFAPATDGTAITVTGYQITAYADGVAQKTVTFENTRTTQTISGLKNGKAYRFAVAAINVSGAGPNSPASAAIKVGGPAAPTAVRAATVRTRRVRITFVPGAANGARITEFTAICTSSNGGARKITTRTTGPIEMAGLTHGKRYTCSVSATNVNGTSPTSKPSRPVNV